MPVYEFQCEDCGERMETRASVEEYARGLKPVCPKCGSTKLKRVVSRIMILGGGRGGSCGPSSGSGCCGGGTG